MCWRSWKPFCWGLRRRKKTGMPAWKPSNSAYLKCRKPKITEEAVLGHQNTLNVPSSIFGRCELLSNNGTGQWHSRWEKLYLGHSQRHSADISGPPVLRNRRTSNPAITRKNDVQYRRVVERDAGLNDFEPSVQVGTR